MQTDQNSETRFVLVRHGQTAFNVQRRIQGHLDEPLDRTGLSQADALVAGLVGELFDGVFCSDLQRTRQKLAPYARSSGCQVSYLTSLRERHFGQFEGLTRDEVRQQFPAEAARFVQRDPDYDLGGGESTRVFYQRCVQALTQIAVQHPGATVLVVTHGGVLDCVQRWARTLDLAQPRDFEILNASINRVKVGAGRCQILDWADDAHLGAG